jgi:hypothetical protein
LSESPFRKQWRIEYRKESGHYGFIQLFPRAGGRYGIELEFEAIWKHLLKTIFIQIIKCLTGDEAQEA